MNWFKKVKDKFRTILSRGRISKSDIEEIESLLLQGDIGPEITSEFLRHLEENFLVAKAQVDPLQLLRELLYNALPPYQNLNESHSYPNVYLFLGVNGSGKTTSIAKIANLLKSEADSVLLACADTFRAAAKEQLQFWAQSLNLPFIGYPVGGDPAALVFDAIDMAYKRGIKYVLIDTAGRQHTDINLMEELKKIKRVINKKKENDPEETLLILDANAGLNAINQAAEFHSALGLTGLLISKFDSPAKAGYLLTIQKQLDLPVKFLGVGERIDDLLPYSKELFLQKFLS